MQSIKNFLGWTVYNGLFAWATYAACILGSAVGYNFMAWITGFMLVIVGIGFFSLRILKREAPDKFVQLKDVYNGAWHINRYLDILYDACIVGLMIYAGFLGIATVYVSSMFFQHLYLNEIRGAGEPTSEDIISEYDDTILDRLGIDQNERGR